MTDTEAFRRQPPAPLPERPLNLPEPSETQLANGLRVIVVEQRRLPLVSFRLAVRSGDSSDTTGSSSCRTTPCCSSSAT